MRRNIVIFDFEVFKFDTLLGAIVLRDDDAEVFQTWNLAEMIKFYEANKQSIWVGHNNAFTTTTSCKKLFVDVVRPPSKRSLMSSFNILVSRISISRCIGMT